MDALDVARGHVGNVGHKVGNGALGVGVLLLDVERRENVVDLAQDTGLVDVHMADAHLVRLLGRDGTQVDLGAVDGADGD